MVQGHQKLYSHVPNTQIHKCTNTAYDQVPERPNMWYIFEKRIQWIICVSSVYHQCIISALSVHHQRIISASSAHHQRLISASTVHHCSVFIAELSPVYCCLVVFFFLHCGMLTTLQLTWTWAGSYTNLIKNFFLTKLRMLFPLEAASWFVR